MHLEPIYATNGESRCGSYRDCTMEHGELVAQASLNSSGAANSDHPTCTCTAESPGVEVRRWDRFLSSAQRVVASNVFYHAKPFASYVANSGVQFLEARRKDEMSRFPTRPETTTVCLAPCLFVVFRFTSTADHGRSSARDSIGPRFQWVRRVLRTRWKSRGGIVDLCGPNGSILRLDGFVSRPVTAWKGKVPVEKTGGNPTRLDGAGVGSKPLGQKVSMQQGRPDPVPYAWRYFLDSHG